MTTVLDHNPLVVALEGWTMDQWVQRDFEVERRGGLAWCAVGRMNYLERTKRIGHGENVEAQKLLSRAAGEIVLIPSIMGLNDTTSFPVVQAAFRKAAAWWDESHPDTNAVRRQRRERRRVAARAALLEAQAATKVYHSVTPLPPAPFEMDMPENWVESWSHSADLTVPLDRELVSV